MVKTFKSYEIEEFNAEYGTRITDSMSSSAVAQNIGEKVRLMFASRNSDDVILDCEKLKEDTGQDCQWMEVAGVYLAVLD